MDITPLFKARLEVAKNRSKALGDGTSAHPKRKIFPSKKSEYHVKARECIHTISGLRKYLNENRALYLQPDKNPAGIGGQSGEYDRERDQIDVNIHKIIQNSQSRIQGIKLLIDTNGITVNTNPQLRTHLDNVLNSLHDYVKEVGAQYSEMRAIRVKRTLGMQTMSKLYPKSSYSNRAFESNQSYQSPSSSSSFKQENRPLMDQDEPTSTKTLSSYLEDEEELSPEELQILEKENQELLNQLHSLADHVDQIQSNVVNIAELQTIFTEKVLEQDKDIELISNTVVNATENVKGGNEQIRQAIQQNADFRVWILFFIIIMSLSLLFLDWYND